MKRCLHFFLGATLLALASLLALPALAQTDDVPSVRNFPKTALRGLMVVRAPPEISINGKPDRLSPGARIRNINNNYVLSGSLLGQELLVNYTRDTGGLVYEVWILNPEEAKEKRAGLNTRNFSFSSESAAAPQDDGKTPYKQLPGYKQ
ncbi:MAG: hypothetical protein Q8M51_04265 [Polaromonas sp.]|uniref:hypothetical protein n=1 Tax=Polaromonas sp. TaxID=1869339 RepID=UPI002730E398|nr:hypothetical protein [Polaromonas sp.]MDP1739684.1 hypothetical protein [Polaromonas sp.]MDP1956007.1 hypothetical protein [Polaromonas sp.]MDP3355059.1 hypothetical protein [Polaromonas sp.]MDP3751173.1 hypothetical protein [Polaromonas sp.]